MTGRQLILSVAGHSQLASKSTISTSLNLIPAVVIRIYTKGPVSTAAQAALAAFRIYTYRQENFTGMKPMRLATMRRRLAARDVAAPLGARVSRLNEWKQSIDSRQVACDELSRVIQEENSAAREPSETGETG
jgi:hypothetical protein